MPYYRIIEKRSPLTFVVKNVLTGQVVKSHASNLKYANLEDWDVTDPNLPSPVTKGNDRPIRKSTFVVPPSDSSDSEGSADEPTKGDPEELVKKFQFERTDSSSLSDSDDDVPIAELIKKFRRRDVNQSGKHLPVNNSSDSDIRNDDHENMEIDAVTTTAKPKNGRRAVQQKSSREADLSTLFKTIGSMLSK